MLFGTIHVWDSKFLVHSSVPLRCLESRCFSSVQYLSFLHWRHLYVEKFFKTETTFFAFSLHASLHLLTTECTTISLCLYAVIPMRMPLLYGLNVGFCCCSLDTLISGSLSQQQTVKGRLPSRGIAKLSKINTGFHEYLDGLHFD